MDDYYVVSYDIQDDKRRAKVSKALKNFGERIQYSVFECVLNKRQFLRLKDQLERLIDSETDSVIFYLLCHSCLKHLERYGQIRKSLDKEDYIV